MRRAALALLAAGLAGCGTLSRDAALGTDAGGDKVRTVVPNRTLNLSPSVQIPIEGLLLGAAVYWYVDPFAPNWQVAQTQVGEDRYRIALKRKPIAAGGDGEAEVVFRRRAEQLARERGRSDYVVLEYTTGIDSKLPFSQRVASGVVQLR